MFATNPEREKTIYDLWRTRHTIDEIADLTRVPRSTVGYYVRRFNKNLRKQGLKLDGDLNPLLIKPKSVENESTPPIVKRLSGDYKISSLIQIMDTIQELENTKEYDQIYYFLHSLQLFPKVLECFKAIPGEENQLIDKFIKSNKDKINKGNVFAHMVQPILSSFTISKLQTETYETPGSKNSKLDAASYLGLP